MSITISDAKHLQDLAGEWEGARTACIKLANSKDQGVHATALAERATTWAKLAEAEHALATFVRELGR